MELGGHAPVIVCEDAGLDRAVEASVQAKFRNAGQVCVSPSRFFAHESLAAEFIERVANRASALRVGPGNDPRSEVGPLANPRRLAAVHNLVSDAVANGATLCTGGHRTPGFARGLFYSPTVLSEVSTSMAVMRDEPFGPVAPIVSFSSLDEAIELANDTPFGLAGYLFTDDLRTAHVAAEGLEAGVVGVNHLVPATVEAPFGGIKQSGFGRENGIEGIDAYLVTKYINFQL